MFTQEGFGEVLSRRPSYSCSSGTPQQQHSFAQLTFFSRPPTPGNNSLSGIGQLTLLEASISAASPVYAKPLWLSCYHALRHTYAFASTIRAFRDCSSLGLVTAPLGQRPANRRRQSLPASRNKRSVVRVLCTCLRIVASCFHTPLCCSCSHTVASVLVAWCRTSHEQTSTSSERHLRSVDATDGGYPHSESFDLKEMNPLKSLISADPKCCSAHSGCFVVFCEVEGEETAWSCSKE